MTREEAIQWLTDIKENITENWSHDVAIDMAIEALSAEYEDYEHATLVDIKEPLKVLVVRCKDCRHRVHDEERNLYYCEMYYGQGDVSDKNFCQWGERKEPLPQYKEWQDEFNKMCESAKVGDDNE